MTNPLQTIPNLPALPGVSGAEQLWVNLAGTDYRTTSGAIAAYIAAAGLIETGPYPGQVSQTFTQVANTGFLNIFSYLTAAQQGAVQAGTSTVDFAPILVAAIAALQVNVLPSTGQGSHNGTNVIFFPPGTYPFLSTVNIKHSVVIEGAGGQGSGGFGIGTKLFWAPNTSGIIVNRTNTFGNTTTGFTSGGDGTVFRKLAIYGQTSSTDPTVFGIWMRARAVLEDCTVRGFAGQQIQILATAGSGGATEGNANHWQLNRVNVADGINGVYISGADVNAGTSIAVVSGNHYGSAMLDSSFLGNVHVGPESDFCGLAAFTRYMGQAYVANPTTTSALLDSTTPGTNSAVWIATTTPRTVPTWPATPASGAYYPGPGYSGTSAAATMFWINAYNEGGNPPSYGASGNLATGLEANGWTGSAQWYNASQAFIVNFTGGWGSRGNNGTESVETDFGGEFANGNIFQFTAGTNFPGVFRMRQSGTLIREDYSNADNAVYNARLGPLTAVNFGRVAAQPYVFFNPRVYIPDSTNVIDPTSMARARAMWNETAQPNTTGYAVGEIVWNRSPTPSTALQWALRTQGTPDTWFASYAYPRNDPSTGVGYVTGAGGAVTQATSRVTGVTLNTVTGAITLVSAAGSASVQSFVVTNTSVGANDTVSISQTSGTDDYIVSARVANGGGAFKVFFQTTSGTTTEQPVFQFNLIKGAIS